MDEKRTVQKSSALRGPVRFFETKFPNRLALSLHAKHTWACMAGSGIGRLASSIGLTK
jgi:hypothetical protein